MSGEQLAQVCTRLTERCAAGNNWPPDLAEFITLAAECAGGALGFTPGDVVTEYRRWRENAWRYDGADEFPWRHPVLYHICLELRQKGIERRLAPVEHEKLAGTLLLRWEKKIAAGYSVPPIRRQIAAPAHPAGLTPAQELHEQYLRRKAGKLN